MILVQGVDGCLTIVHRILLHENLGEVHWGYLVVLRWLLLWRLVALG